MNKPDCVCLRRGPHINEVRQAGKLLRSQAICTKTRVEDRTLVLGERGGGTGVQSRVTA